MLQIKNEDADFGWGVVVNFSKKTNTKVSQRLQSLMLLYFIRNLVVNQHKTDHNREYALIKAFLLQLWLCILGYCPAGDSVSNFFAVSDLFPLFISINLYTN